MQDDVTRSQAKMQAKPIKPLKVIDNLGDYVTREKLITLQKQDASLSTFMTEAEQNQKVEKSGVYFRMKNRILYRYCENFGGRKIAQVVIRRDREKVMTMAHDAVMSRHQGRKKTYYRI